MIIRELLAEARAAVDGVLHEERLNTILLAANASEEEAHDLVKWRALLASRLQEAHRLFRVGNNSPR